MSLDKDQMEAQDMKLLEQLDHELVEHKARGNEYWDQFYKEISEYAECLKSEMNI